MKIQSVEASGDRPSEVHSQTCETVRKRDRAAFTLGPPGLRGPYHSQSAWMPIARIIMNVSAAIADLLLATGLLRGSVTLRRTAVNKAG